MTELLAPAGSVEALKSAVNAGCDAVYIGGRMFGARAYANNPDRDELLGAIDHCHLFDKKLYLTVNTLLKNDELTDSLYDFLRPYYEEGLDGVIVSDPGVMKAVSHLFPGLPIHISTQASVTSAEGARVIAGLADGITRVVPARELSIEEIELFKKNTDLEVEVFVHGAMCVCYSGQCLMSSIAGGRSGNRGRCAQPCRKNYDTGVNDSFILSCKDMCTIPAIGRLMRAGVDSFKIEGRMKSPIYVAATVAAYRKYMDIAAEQGERYEQFLESHKRELEKDIEKLREIYNRGGFCTGFMLGEKNLICSDKASHNGVAVGSVSGVSGREATITFDKEINRGDVLEIRRDDGSSLYEYTSGSEFSVGDSFKILVSKGQKATVGQRVFRVRNNVVIDDINGRYVEATIGRKIGIRFEAGLSRPLELNAYTLDGDDRHEVTVCGACPEQAKTASADIGNIRKHLCKTGDSVFSIAESDIRLEDGLFIPVGALNTLRREALDALERKIVSSFKRAESAVDAGRVIAELTEDFFYKFGSHDGAQVKAQGDAQEESQVKVVNKMHNVGHEPHLHALVSFEESIAPVLSDKRIKRIYLPLVKLHDLDEEIRKFTALADRLKAEDRELYIALPFICRSEVLRKFKESGLVDKLYKHCGFLVRNNEELSLFEEKKEARVILDHTMHVFNRVTAGLYGSDFTYSPELNKDELVSFGKQAKGELIVYGRLPLMQTAHCPYRNEGLECLKGRNTGAFSESFLKLKDSKGYVFPVIRRCDYCTNIILNSSVLDLRDLKSEIQEIAPASIRYEFTTESVDTIENVLNGAGEDGVEYTFGHFRRGVL